MKTDLERAESADLPIACSSPSVSVVLLTLDRSGPVRDTLDALKWQTYDNFEVVVVAGPCRDDTLSTLASYGQAITVVHNAERNVCMSRNIGATAANGEFLLFLDDDEIPEPGWIADLIAGFGDGDSLGAVGGAVIGPNGTDLDWLHCAADMYGAAYLSIDSPTHLATSDPSDPARRRLQYLPGGNCAIKRSALNAIGGFDEMIVYYLDETDMFFRLQQAGWTVRQLTNARIHHRYLAGIVRKADDRLTTNWVPIVQSRGYCAGKFALELVGADRVIEEFSEFCDHVRTTITDDEALVVIDQAIEETKARIRNLADENDIGQVPRSHYVVRDADNTRFHRFPSFDVATAEHIVVVENQESSTSIEATAIEATGLRTARSIADRGHHTRLIVTGTDSHVRWHRGVWIHSIVAGQTDMIAEELLAIDARQPVDRVVCDNPGSVNSKWTCVPSSWATPTTPTTPALAALTRWSARELARNLLDAVRISAWPRDRVFVRLIGGAGNELFQYASAISIAGPSRVRTIPNDRANQLPAGDLVPGLLDQAGETELRLLRRRSASGQVCVPPSASRLSTSIRKSLDSRTVDQHGTLQRAFMPRPQSPARPQILDGYFQHPEWFKPGDSVVIDALLDNAPQGWLERARSARFAAVSFRHGDFEDLGWTLPDSYYDAALAELAVGTQLMVVSDDAKFGAMMSASYRDRGFTVLDPPALARDPAINDFWTIAAASDVIMSNSTFCWWATRVGDVAHSSILPRVRQVTCPLRWVPDIDNSLAEPEWTTIGGFFGR